MVYSLVSDYTYSHDFTHDWIWQYIPVPYPIPQEHYTTAIIGTG